MKKIILLTVFLMTSMMLFCATPLMAAENEESDTVTVYVTLSHNGSLVQSNGETATVLAHIPVTVNYFDLADYGLAKYGCYGESGDANGGENVKEQTIERPTLLHLLIRILEDYYLGGETLTPGSAGLTVVGSAGHMQITSFWGHAESLMCYANHSKVLQSGGKNAAADNILLKDGMEIDLAMFSDAGFRTRGAFAYFDQRTVTVGAGEAFNLKMLASFTGASDASESAADESLFDAYPMAGEDVFISKDHGVTWQTAANGTDEEGTVSLCFDEPGTYYVSSDNVYVNFPCRYENSALIPLGDDGKPCAAPPIAVITVEKAAKAAKTEGKSIASASVASVESSSFSGYFYFVVETKEALVVPPEKVYYTATDTIREALLNTGHTFFDLSTNFGLTLIDDVPGGYMISDQNGKYDLGALASTVETLRISESESILTTSQAALINAMGRYNAASEKLKSYKVAKDAYQKALSAYLNAGDSEAAALAATLNQAINDYENQDVGTKYTVTFQVTQNQTPLSGAHTVATNRFGTEYATDGSILSLVAGKYDFSVTYQQNEISGNFTVSNKNVTLNLDFTSLNWLKEMKFAKESKGEYYKSAKVDGHTYNFFVPDTMSKLYIYMERNDAAGVPFVSVENPKSWYLDYIDANGQAKAGSFFSWTNTVRSVEDFLALGSESRSLPCAIRYTDPATGYVSSQYYTANFKRVPTLASLSVSDGTNLIAGGKPFDPLTEAYTYMVLPTVNKVTVSAKAFGSAEEGYSVTVDGETLAASGSKEVNLTGAETQIAVKVSLAGGESRTYQLTVNRNTTASEVTFNHDAAVTVEVQNAAGNTVAPQEGGGYQLVTGETYRYIATKDVYFHTSADFVASPGQTVPVSVDSSKHWLSALSFRNSNSATGGAAYDLTPAFAKASHAYTMTVSDFDNQVYIWATTSAEAQSATVTVSYTQLSSQRDYNKKEQTTVLASGAVTGQTLLNFAPYGGYGNELTVRVSQTQGNITSYQDYVLQAKRTLTIDSLSLLNGERNLTLQRTGSSKTGFDGSISDYTVEIPETTEKLSLNYVCNLTVTLFGQENDGYSVTVNGQSVPVSSEESGSVEIPLDTAKQTETVTVVVHHEEASNADHTYTLQVNKKPPVAIKFNCAPAGAILMVTEKLTGFREWPDANGAYQLMPGYEYTYTVSKSGYVTKQSSFTVTSAKTIPVTLTEAEPNESIDPDIPSEWPSFRGNGDNNCVTDAPMMTAAEDAVLSWATKLGESYSTASVGSPIIVDGYLYTYAGSKIFKIDTISGKVVKTGQMDHSSNFAITPPAYAQGMIFVGLSEGTIQAFNADTMESLWIYKDPLGGQPNSPITYHDGYLYTGFWTGETYNANYVCISITDEDISKEKEKKVPTWVHTQKGGFYWAGAYVSDKYLLVGTDDGEPGSGSNTAQILSLDPLSGKVIDRLDGIAGDMRSSVAYDKATDRFYFTSKNGYFYAITVDESGAINQEGKKSLKLKNSSGGTPMSTSTPAVYNGRAYIGVSGKDQFGPYGGHNITVIDLTSWSIAYAVPTQGYPQTSGLLTTAYEAEDGYAYVYFFDNYTPGKLRLIKDKPGVVAPLLTTTETYNNGNSTANVAYNLFTPAYEQGEYAICSPIADEYGFIYFKNDSSYLMALGPTVEKLEVTKAPNKTSYEPGETFDPSGMKVTVGYSNGVVRDVTDYVSYITRPLTKNDQEIYITFDYVMYQNKDGASGVKYEKPFTFIDITVSGDGVGAVQGVINQIDALPAAAELTLTNRKAVEIARVAYDALSETEKAAVTNASKLTAAEAKMAELKAAAPRVGDMKDVKSTDWFYDDVSYVLSYGIFNGLTGTTFGPGDDMTRGQFVTTIGRIEGVKSLSDGGSGKTAFGDVKATSYYAPYVKWASENNIVNGIGDGKFSPEAKITREQMAAIILRYAKLKGISLTDGGGAERFADDGSIASYAKEAVYAMKASGIINGMGGNQFVPKGTATRGQAAKILHLLNELR
ncbi:MAG TPA: S-layer homology domain-containing protein [Clostridiales bacterium]|nr:S-layer homology domain-containing protein [Clostridiales bacterium]